MNKRKNLPKIKLIKKHELKVEIDTSGVEEYQARLKKEETDRIRKLAEQFNKQNQVSVGTRKGINSIMKKAKNRHKVAKEVSDKYVEEKKSKKKTGHKS